jgi:putative copper resistance protein D
MNAPTLPALLVGHWVVSWPLTGEALLVAWLYLWAARRVRGGWPRRRQVAFLAGMATLLIALESGFDTFDDQLLSVHMEQHLLLLEVVPLLVLLGQPVMLALRVLPPDGRVTLARNLRRAGPYTHPAACLAVFAAIVLGCHLPVFFDATVRHQALHDFEHGLFLLAGLLLWWPLVGADPSPRRALNGFERIVYVIVAMVPMTIVGAYLDRATDVVYAPYAATSPGFGVSAVLDQQNAGAIMWVAGSCVMVAAGLWAAVHALMEEERRQRARDARDDRAMARLAKGPR